MIQIFKNRTCPQCKNHEFIFDKKDYVVYCTRRHLVVSASYDYCSGNKIELDFGLLK